MVVPVWDTWVATSCRIVLRHLAFHYDKDLLGYASNQLPANACLARAIRKSLERAG
jgi:hypothetical protein